MDRQPQRACLARPPAVAAALLALLCALALSVARARALEVEEEPPLDPNPEPPSFVVIQTDDQTLDELYAAFTPFPGAAPIRAMPNTLELIAEKGKTFNRYYVSYPLCCPSRVSLLTGRYAHNTGVKGNVQPNGGYYGFSFRAAYSHNLATWLQGAGYRTIHIGKFLNGYGDEPYDNGTTVPPGWDAWHTVLNADTHHYFYGYTLNNNGQISEPYGDSGSWEPREYSERDPAGCPFAPEEGRPCLYETDIFNWMAREEMLATPPEQPFYMQVDYTAPHGDFRHPAGPEPAPRHYDWFKGAKLPHNRSEGFDEGNVSDKPRFIREARTPDPERQADLQGLLREALESLRSVDDGVKEIVDTLGQLHRLRNTYILFTSDNGFFFGEHRLIGGKFLAYEPLDPPALPDPRPRDQAGHVDRRADGEHRHRADHPRPGRGRTGQERRRALDGPLPARSGTAQPPADPLRVLRADQRRRSERGDLLDRRRRRRGSGRRRSTDPKPKAARPAPTRPRTPRSLAPPLNYEGIRLGPYKYIAWPDGEKELYNINKDPNELNNIVRDAELLPDPQLPPPAAAALRELRRARMPRTDATAAADPRSNSNACVPSGSRKSSNTNRNGKRNGANTNGKRSIHRQVRDAPPVTLVHVFPPANRF